MAAPRPIVVLGAGIIGLTTATRLLEAGHDNVHILASHLPSDPLDARYASTIAGAHHLSFADDSDERQTKWDWRTFQVLYDEWKRDGEASGLMRLTQTELWVGSSSHLKIYERHPDFEVVDPSTLPTPCDHAVRFTSLTVTPSIYLARLLDRFLSLGGKLHRVHVHSLAALATPPLQAFYGAPPRTVFVCVGIGARDLGGVKDTAVFPTRGQVVAVRAPWMRAGTTRQVGSLAGGEGGSRTYVIPRVTGEVILGGTREVDDWEAYPRKRTADDILERVLEVCPDIVPPNQRDSGGVDALKGIVTNHLVGFRPSRTDGIRLEREDVIIGGDDVAVIYNYGHGGAGWQSSWGTAESAVRLLGPATPVPSRL